MNNFNITPSTTILQGLGKATRRGIKKCKKCGVYNGTRGLVCKNRQCGTSLKPTEDTMFEFDAVKLVTGPVRHVYSVHVKDHTPECRGFVQLPVLQFCNEEVALCFVDSCQRSFNNSILKCHEEGESNIETAKCQHIELAMKSEVIAKPVNFNKECLNLLRIPYEIKEKLIHLASDKDSPLVQRVSKYVMAVKCQVAPKQPLGYLHFTFVKGRTKVYEKYYCNCTEYLVSVSGPCDKSASIRYKCIHYYACIAALCSDPNYFDEFYNFINNEIDPEKNIWCSIPKVTKQIDVVDLKKKNKINIICNNLVRKPIVMKKSWNKYPDNTQQFKNILTKFQLDFIIQLRLVNIGIFELAFERLFQKIDSAANQVDTKKKYVLKRCKKIVPKIYPIEIKILSDPSLNNTLESDSIWHFLDWLAFVTESINGTMQFVNCGIVNSQVFYIPEIFFESFKSRIPKIYEGQSTELGSVFYSVMNINHVKEIFDTPKVKLRIAKKFVHVENKGYVEYDETNETNNQFQQSFIFFLNVGPSTVDESDNYNNAFIIEWLPNICATTKIGQFKLQYKYGRKGI